MEVFRKIPQFEKYKVSNYGNVIGSKGKLLKPIMSNGYFSVCLGRRKRINIHQMVAMAFLNHKPNGGVIVVDHINGIKTDNRLENLQVITQRENVKKGNRKGISKYMGVSYKQNKWTARIFTNKKSIWIGSFNCELKAAYEYNKHLKTLL